MDVGEAPPTNCGYRYYKNWINPVSGKDSDKLTEKFTKKVEMKLQDTTDRALDMLSNLNLGGV